MILQNTRINTGHENYGFLLGYRNSRFYLLWTIMVTSRAFLFLPCSGQLPVMTPIRFKWNCHNLKCRTIKYRTLHLCTSGQILQYWIFFKIKPSSTIAIFLHLKVQQMHLTSAVLMAALKGERRVTVVILCWLIHLEFIRSRTGVQKPVPCCPHQSLQNWTQKVLTSSLITSHTRIMNLNSFVSTKRENNQH